MSSAITDKKTSNTKLNELEQIKNFTTVVADTVDFESIREFKLQDATTNPSLVYAATQKPNYSHFLKEVLVDRRNSGLVGAAQMEDIIDHLLVRFGCAMLEIVPGRVSTETDARFSFDVQGSIRKAQRLVKLYEEQGIGRERVLIKIASTWEGIMAAEQLQREGIKCNMRLLFSLPQVVRAAEAKVQLISPFVGRIYDWFKAAKKARVFRRRKSRRAIGAGNLHLLQTLRLRDRSDGRKFSQCRSDPRVGGVRSAHDQSGIDETAFRIL